MTDAEKRAEEVRQAGQTGTARGETTVGFMTPDGRAWVRRGNFEIVEIEAPVRPGNLWELAEKWRRWRQQRENDRESPPEE